MKREMPFDQRIALVAKKHGLKPRWQQLKYGLKRAVFDCDSYEEMYAVETIFGRMKGIVCEHWSCSEGIFEGRVYAMDSGEQEELERQSTAEMAAVEDWWQRYHAADEETRRLMACGALA